MPRSARIVAVGVPQHITVRGNRQQDVFFTDEDRLRYLAWLYEYAKRFEFHVYAYCLMTNHTHIVGKPLNALGMGRMMRILSTRHSQLVNKAHNWTGHLWQSRYYSTMLDESHLYRAVRYVEQNPVRAGMVADAADYAWSSAGCHCGLRIDPVVSGDQAWSGALDDWPRLLRENLDDETLERLRTCTNSGKPYGDEEFTKRLGELIGHPIERRPRGRPRIDVDQVDG